MGKIPRKIESGFDGFCADEYHNWTILFSVYALKGVIPQKHLDYFRKFVLICQHLWRQVISKRDIVVAHELLLQFSGVLSNCMGLTELRHTCIFIVI